MNPTQETIDALVQLEAYYHYTPQGENDLARDAILGQPEDPIGSGFADLILHFEDQKRYDDCARIIRAILDTYAPRRCVLDFDGGGAAKAETLERTLWVVRLKGQGDTFISCSLHRYDYEQHYETCNPREALCFPTAASAIASIMNHKDPQAFEAFEVKA